MGARDANPARKSAPTFLFALALLMSLSAMSFALTDAENLLKFKDSLTDSYALQNWNTSTTPCSLNFANWIGVLCSNGTIFGLKLEHMGLSGTIDVDTLAEMPGLRTLSLMNNKFEGPLPNIKKLVSLRSLYLSNNQFSGKILDDAFEGMNSLRKLYMANNKFTGDIPRSIVNLPRLAELRLEANQFQGAIPEFQPDSLRTLNLANNQLEGQIPASLSKMDASTFAGNKYLCGPPLDTCVLRPMENNVNQPNEGQGQQNPDQEKEITTLRILIIVIVSGIALGIIAAIFVFCLRKRKRDQMPRLSPIDDSNKLPSTGYEKVAAQKTLEPVETKKKVDNYGKLSFVRDDIEPFDLQDMLRSSAEVLGSGTFGASYKTVISTGQAYVVKRYKQMNSVGREDFHEHMRRLGRLSHPNLLRLTAFYYRREEKLLVYEYVENGSLASKLHGNHTSGLEWQTRLKIIRGVAKGLAYLHNELPSSVIPHGHLKSSNVLLDRYNEPLLTDYALRPVMNQDKAHALMLAYKSPEFASIAKISKKADVWSLGILILEVLTGKFPENYLTQGYDRSSSLSSWVNNMVKEKRTSEVFDKEMDGTKDSKSEMINLLKIGLSCCEEDVQTRMELKEVVEKIEQLNEADDDEDRLSDGYESQFSTRS